MPGDDTKPLHETHCSFCLKRKSEVRTLISSQTGHYICDECVKRYRSELGDTDSPPPKK